MKDKSKPSRLMQVFEMENDFIKHRQKITKVKLKNTGRQLKRQCKSQMNMIESFRKNWMKASVFKSNCIKKQISHENRLLHDSLFKQYNRTKSLVKYDTELNDTIRSRSSSRSLLRTASKSRLIQEDNCRLMKKILKIESSLSKNTMDEQYFKLRETRQRLEVFSYRNKERMRNNLKKMNIEPTVNFPSSKQTYSFRK